MGTGRIAFLGSGETSLAGGRIFESLARDASGPLRIAILETPAGFELNSGQVARRVGDFLATRLQNYDPRVAIVPARKRGTPFSPDDPEILEPMLTADMFFLGPGSPTYAVRQLEGSLAWDILRARHRQGATLAFASAATIAAGARVLPVYEIFKAGQDVHSVPGLGLFADFGLDLSVIPHWNNAEGGADLDTSRCFVGLERFAEWCGGLPPESVILGLDEHTGVVIDLEAGTCQVSGVSSISVVRECVPEVYASGSQFPLAALGRPELPDPPDAGIPAEVWEMVVQAAQAPGAGPPEQVVALAERRRQARAQKDWPESDRLRDEIAQLGWQVQDTPEGYNLAPGA